MHRIEVTACAKKFLLIIGRFVALAAFFGHRARHGEFLLFLLTRLKGRTLSGDETFEFGKQVRLHLGFFHDRCRLYELSLLYQLEMVLSRLGQSQCLCDQFPVFHLLLIHELFEQDDFLRLRFTL